MARLGSFDPDLVAVENFDVAATPAGAVDRDVVPPPEAPPPPPPPPPKPTIRKFGNPVGGPSWPFYDIVGSGEWSAWTDQQWDQYWQGLTDSPMMVGSAGLPAPYTAETEASYAIMAFGKDAVVRALTDGHVTFFIDPQAGLCAKITETSGRQSVYAGLQRTVGQSRYVRAGDIFGITPDHHIKPTYKQLDVVVTNEKQGLRSKDTKIALSPAPATDPIVKFVRVPGKTKKLALVVTSIVTMLLGVFIGSRLPKASKASSPTKKRPRRPRRGKLP